MFRLQSIVTAQFEVLERPGFRRKLERLRLVTQELYKHETTFARPRNPFFAGHGFARAGSAGLIHDKNIVFLPARTQGPALAIDVIRPRAPGRYPGVMLIHGGDFHRENRSDLLPQALKIARTGYVAATMDYRLTPRFPVSGAIARR